MAQTRLERLYEHPEHWIFDALYPNGPRPVGGGSLGLTTSITQYGITWTFAAEVEHGQFVMGDYWVKDAGNGVTVISQSPVMANDRNGSMVNPTVSTQAYDSRADNFDAANRVSYPLALSTGDSLITSVSNPDESGAATSSWWGSLGSHIRILDYAVLTCVDTVPAANAFRPPWLAGPKPIYTTDDIDLSRLPNVSAPASTPSDVSFYERGFERPWVSHLGGWKARSMNAINNMPTYHTWMGEFLCTALNLFAVGAHTERMLHGFCQTAIDQYHICIAGGGPRAIFEAVTIIGGHLLQDDAMRDLFSSGNSLTTGRAETKMYFWDRKESTVSSSIVTEGVTWTGSTVYWRTNPGEEHEHLHPSEWHLTNIGSGGMKSEQDYRLGTDEHGHVGSSMAVRLFGLPDKFTDGAPDAYLTRWMTEDYNGTFRPIVQATYGSFTATASGSLGSTFLDDLYAQEYA